MIGDLINNSFKYFIDIFADFYTSNVLKWFIYILVLILNFIAYYQNPVLRTDVAKCSGISCRWFSFITGIGAMCIYLFGLVGLWYVAPFSTNMPDYWYVPVIILTYAIIIQMTLSVKMYTNTGNDNDNLNPPPSDLLPIKDRVRLYVLILILDAIFFHQMYLDGGQALLKKHSVWDKYIISRFGSITNFYSFALGWFGLVGLGLDLLSIKFIADFNACDYDLPKSWNY
jgi:hypothetical protein